MKKYINIVWILLFSTCTNKTQVIGKYFSKKSPHRLEIKADSTFIYEYGLISLYQHSTGQWKLKGKNLILNSIIKSTIVPIEIVKLEQIASRNNIISFELKTIGNKNLEEYRCIVNLNDKLSYNRRCDSLSSIFVDYPIGKIQVDFVRMPQKITTTYISPNIMTDDFLPDIRMGNKIQMQININDSLFYYKSFKNDTIKIGRNKIKFYDKKNQKEYIMPKVKDGMNIFNRYNNTSRGLNTF